ncbi:hypothetical protein NOR_02704 [Metarhizium rileyi]|uniref:Uncharacterized protein n=1 Tax=Metarhizium rileyi (strain RCEF 4871) TaxID=1649241 RepID=A0A162JP91_METRR|nr:hypothetical protein NOR_02704 [Metarhizium rileyi RCEF 4871]TWU75130.1 hypothetical protein ED733_002672 [Metarhizium rileyi]
MPVARGFIKTTPEGDHFISDFVIDGNHYQFNGEMHPPVHNLMSDDARLEYESPEQLSTHQGFEGMIGATETKLHLQNGPHIVGHLNMPIVPPSRVMGRGNWSHN